MESIAPVAMGIQGYPLAQAAVVAASEGDDLDVKCLDIDLRLLSGKRLGMVRIASVALGRQLVVLARDLLGRPTAIVTVTRGSCTAPKIDTVPLEQQGFHKDEELCNVSISPLIEEEMRIYINTLEDLENQQRKGWQVWENTENITFARYFSQSLENVTLPSSLQNITFGAAFNQSLVNVTLPSSLLSITFGWDFNQSLENVMLPSKLQSIAFGESFNQSLENARLPNSLHSITFGFDFNQSLEMVTLPSSLQSIKIGENFDQSLKNVTLPNSLQSITFKGDVDQSLEKDMLPCGCVVIRE